MKSVLLKKKKKKANSKKFRGRVEEGKKCFPFTSAREEEWQEWIGEVRTVPRWRWRQPMKVTVASPSSAQRSVSLSSHRCTVLAIAFGCPLACSSGTRSRVRRKRRVLC